MASHESTPKKMNTKLILIASLGLVLPALVIAIAFFAIQNDAKNQREYDRIRQEQAEKFEQQKLQQDLKQSETQIES